MKTPFKDMHLVLSWESRRMGAISASTLRAAVSEAHERQTALCALLAEAGVLFREVDPETTELQDRINDLNIRMTSARHEIALEEAEEVWPRHRSR